MSSSSLSGTTYDLTAFVVLRRGRFRFLLVAAPATWRRVDEVIGIRALELLSHLDFILEGELALVVLVLVLSTTPVLLGS